MLGAIEAFIIETPNAVMDTYMANPSEQAEFNDFSFDEKAMSDEEIAREQERMSSSSEYAVKKDMTSSGEFVRRFNLMTEDIQLRRDFYSESKNMLHRRSGTNGEDLILYNTRLKKWYRSTEGTEAGQPEYNDEIKIGLKENKTNELIAFHNHPLGMPPSVEDLNAALRNRYAKGYTLGHNGRIFEYTAPQERIPESIYNARVSRYLKKGNSEFEAQYVALNDLSKLYGFVFKEVK